jgi:hypothetical protein
MSDSRDVEMLQTLQEIRDGQREAIALAREQLRLAESQLAKSQSMLEESVGIQRAAMQRFRGMTIIALPLILFCVAAILYLIFRYF